MTSQTSGLNGVLNGTPRESTVKSEGRDDIGEAGAKAGGKATKIDDHTTSETTTPSTHPPTKQNKRLEVGRLIREFQSKLGGDWEKYHEALSLFLIGKLSRFELVSTITPILKDGLFKYHNKLLLLNFSNAMKDGPLDFSNEFASFWNKKAQKTSKVKSTQYEKFKQNIMGLPIRERRRIKNIARDSGKRGKLSAGITLTRHSLLPKIPMIQDKEQQQLQVNNLVQWQQDVVNGINTPIATENFELPEDDNLSRRILMTMREHGLTGGLAPQVLEVVLLGLEAHLKNVVESAIDVAKYRENKYTINDYIPLDTSTKFLETDLSKPIPKKRSFEDMENYGLNSSKDMTLNIEDMYNTLEMFPHLIEPCGPKYRLANVMLENDDAISQTLDYTLPPKPAPALNIPLPGIDTKSISTNISDHNGAKLNGSVKIQKDESAKDIELKTGSSISTQVRSDAHIGTTDELKWVLHDLISTM